jgi:hypothetical protein
MYERKKVLFERKSGPSAFGTVSTADMAPLNINRLISAYYAR